MDRFFVGGQQGRKLRHGNARHPELSHEADAVDPTDNDVDGEGCRDAEQPKFAYSIALAAANRGGAAVPVR
jgi:hypothetical protein